LTSAELRWKSLKLRFDEVERQRYLKTAGPKAKLPPVPSIVNEYE
jgi:hypothetical protein